MAREKEQETVALAEAVHAGGTAAEQELFERFDPGLRFVFGRNVPEPVAEDLRQEAFRILIERLRNEGLSDSIGVGAFLQGIARNLLTAYWRDAARLQTDSRIEDKLEGAEDAYRETVRREEVRIVTAAFERLAIARDRDLLRRRYLLDQDKQAICRDMDLESRQFDRALHKARRRLREIVESLGLGEQQIS